MLYLPDQDPFLSPANRPAKPSRLGWLLLRLPRPGESSLRVAALPRRQPPAHSSRNGWTPVRSGHRPSGNSGDGSFRHAGVEYGPPGKRTPIRGLPRFAVPNPWRRGRRRETGGEAIRAGRPGNRGASCRCTARIVSKSIFGHRASRTEGAFTGARGQLSSTLRTPFRGNGLAYIGDRK